MSLETALKRLELALSKLDVSSNSSSGDSQSPPAISAFDDLYAADIAPFITATRALPAEFQIIADLAEKGFGSLRDVLVASFKVKKPSDEQLMATLFANGVAALQQAGKLADNRSKAFNHQSAFTEFLNCIQWVMIAPAPKPFVLSCRDSADFYLNKILTTFKDDPLKEHHRNFVKFLKSTIENLGEYIKQFFTTGLTWNASGVDVASYNPKDSNAGASSAKAAPAELSVEARINAAAEKLELLALQSKKQRAEKKGDSEEAPSVADYDALLGGPVKDFVTAAKNLGGDIAKLGEISEKGFNNLNFFVRAASKCAKPADDEVTKKFAEIAALMQSVVPDNRNKVAFFHQSAFAEHIQILQWILIAPAPKPFVTGTLEAADFYLNKILTSTKEDPLKNDHRAFVKAIKDITSELADHVKKYHTTGLSWKANGSKFSEFQ